MGSFYTNVTLFGTDLDAAVGAIPGPAFAGALEDDVVVVYAAADDLGESVAGPALSAALGCVALTVSVHDDDLLAFWVHRAGELVTAGIVPDPDDVFGPEVDMAPVPPDAAALVAALGRGDEDAVRSALDRDYVFASDQHRDLCTALALPTTPVGWGFRYLAQESGGYIGPSLTRLGD
jgi:hypothetical protein